MTKRRTKRNVGRSQTRRDFKISKNPAVHPAERGAASAGADRVTPKPLCGQRFLFAIARDAHTIFVTWNIDWQSVFKSAIPVDRKVHLRMIDANGVTEMTVAIEPMGTMHCVTISSLCNSYHMEIGYFQPFDSWHSVAKSDNVEMPAHGSVKLDEVDLATIPFHLGFQQLADLFRAPNNTAVARLASEFQKRVLSSDKPNESSSSETQILHNLNLSPAKMAVAERELRSIDTEKLARRTHPTFRFRGSSWTRGQANPGA